MEPDDKEYYKKRANREREIADECKDKSVASVHRNLADEYDKRGKGTSAALKSVPDP